MIVLKTLHLLSLIAALGAGGARLLAGRFVMQSPDRGPVLLPLMKQLAQVNFAGIAGLWLTGVPLWIAAYGGSFDLGGAFHLKLTMAALLTGLAVYVHIRTAKGNPPPMALGRRIGLVVFSLGVVTIIAAVAAFR